MKHFIKKPKSALRRSVLANSRPSKFDPDSYSSPVIDELDMTAEDVADSIAQNILNKLVDTGYVSQDDYDIINEILHRNVFN